MFVFPNFDPKTLSDADLMAKSAELSAKANWAATSGAGYPVDLLNNMIRMITAELSERAYLSVWNSRQHILNTTNETDPDLRAAALQKLEGPSPEPNKPRPLPRRQVPLATRAPVIPTKEQQSPLKKDQK